MCYLSTRNRVFHKSYLCRRHAQHLSKSIRLWIFILFCMLRLLNVWLLFVCSLIHIQRSRIFVVQSHRYHDALTCGHITHTACRTTCTKTLDCSIEMCSRHARACAYTLTHSSAEVLVGFHGLSYFAWQCIIKNGTFGSDRCDEHSINSL